MHVFNGHVFKGTWTNLFSILFDNLELYKNFCVLIFPTDLTKRVKKYKKNGQMYINKVVKCITSQSVSVHQQVLIVFFSQGSVAVEYLLVPSL